MKKLLLLISITIFFNYVGAQSDLILKDSSGKTFKFNDSNGAIIIDTVDLSNKSILVKYIINNEFSRLVTGNSLTGLGNYANISTADNTFSASINHVTSYGVWDITLSGGSNDDITTFYKNSELNTGIGAGLSLHIPLYRKIKINDQDVGELQDAEIAIKEKYRVELAKFENYEIGYDKQLADKEKEIEKIKQLIKNNVFDAEKDKTLTHKLKTIEAEVDLINKKINFYSNPVNVNNELDKLKDLYAASTDNKPWQKQSFKKDSIEILGKEVVLRDSLKVFEKTKKSILQALKENKKDTVKEKKYKKQLEILQATKVSITNNYNYHKANPNRLLNQKDNKKVQELKANRRKLNDIVAKDVSMIWITIGGEINYNEYTLFDETQVLDKQIVTKKDAVNNFTFAISKYSNISSNVYATRNVKFYSFGAQFNIGNNIKSLELYEVRTTDVITSERELLKKENAYKGVFEDDQFSVDIFTDYYKFFGNKNNIGLHLKGTQSLGQFRPVTSFRVGAVVPFSKIDDLSSYLNVELFLGLNDIFKKAKEESIFSRNIVGLQVTMPFNFKIL